MRPEKHVRFIKPFVPTKLHKWKAFEKGWLEALHYSECWINVHSFPLLTFM